MTERLDDLFLELRALDWELHGFYQRGKKDPPGRPGACVGDECIKEWNVRITRDDWWAHGTGDTPAQAMRAAIDDIQRAMDWKPTRRPPPGQSPISLEDIGL